MAINGMGYSLKKRQITVKVSNEVDFKVFMNGLKRKLPSLRELYVGREPEILIMGKDFKNKEMYSIQKVVNKFFDVDVNFSCSKMLGLHGIRKPFNKEIATSNTKFHRKSLRSGQKVEFEGSIVVLGDVNNGAEVIAGENIIILGALRGLAHAGAKGNKDAIIAAGSIEANQIRISNIIRECNRDEVEDDIIRTNAYVNEEDKIIIE